MKKQISTFFALLFSVFIYAQCTPDGGTANGIRPSSSSVPCAVQTQSFTQTYSIGIPTSTGLFTINSVTIDSITNIPAGMQLYHMNSYPYYQAGEQVCFLITGNTTGNCGQYWIKVYVTMNLSYMGNNFSSKGELNELATQNGLQGFDKPFIRVVGVGDACPQVDGSQTTNFVAYANCGNAPTAVTDAATSVTTGSAQFNGTVNANGHSTSIGFQWGTSTSYTQFSAATPSSLNTSTATAVSASIFGLNNNTTYHYRTIVTYLSNLQIFGADQQFTTGTTVQAPVLSTDAATAVTTSGAQLNGTINANGNTTTNSFDWGTTTAYGQNTSATPGSLSSSSATPVNESLTGLGPNTVYHYRTKVTYNGSTLYGSDQQFTTGTTSSAPVVTTAAATNVTTNSLTLNGTVNANGSATIIDFEWGTTTAYGQTTAATPSSLSTSVSTPVSATLTGLGPNTVYHFRTKVSYSGGPVYGNDQQVTTTTGTTGIDNVDGFAVKIYPNPAQHELTIETPNNGVSAVFVTNALGQKVISTIITATLNRIDVSALPFGVYSVTILNGNNSKTAQVVILGSK